MTKIVRLAVEDFLKGMVIVDVRSPSEFAQGHIPGAINVPLLNDEERKRVGIAYKQQGHLCAVQLGYQLVGGKFEEKLNQMMQLAHNNIIYIYCFRGGLRSTLMAELAEHAGLQVYQLSGGYKKFRQFVLQQLEQPKWVQIIGGATGSGKTKILHQLMAAGYQSIDLEGLASHRGSAFGQIGLSEQPTLEHFQNKLGLAWSHIDPRRPVWLEDESRMIGKINIPEGIFLQMRAANVVYLQMEDHQRRQNIIDEYGVLPKAALIESTLKLKKRLGDERCRMAAQALENNEWEIWADIVMAYYDKAYFFGLSKRAPNSIQKMSLLDFQSKWL